MLDWNLVATTRRGRVLFMTVPDPHEFLVAFERRAAEDPDGVNPLAQVVPVTETWALERPDALEEGLRRLAARRASALGKKRLCVRVTSRQDGGSGPGLDERGLQRAVLEELHRLGARSVPAPIDPDVLLVVHARRDVASAGLFTREELARCPRLRRGFDRPPVARDPAFA